MSTSARFLFAEVVPGSGGVCAPSYRPIIAFWKAMPQL